MLAEVGLDVGEALGHEGVEPLFREVVVDPVITALGQSEPIIGRQAVVLHGPNGPFWGNMSPFLLET